MVVVGANGESTDEPFGRSNLLNDKEKTGGWVSVRVCVIAGPFHIYMDWADASEFGLPHGRCVPGRAGLF